MFLFKPQAIFSNNQTARRSTWGWAIPIMAFIILILGQILTLVPAFESGWIKEEELEHYPNIIYMLLAPFSAMVLLLWLWIRFFEGRNLASIGMTNTDRPAFNYFRGYGFGLAMALLIVLAIWMLGGYELDTEASFQLTDLWPLLILMAGFAVQSGAEEILFRGWLMSRTSEKYGVFVGIAVSSSFFMLMHLIGVDFTNTSALMIGLGIIVSYLFSIFLSLMVIKQQSIWGAAAWHAGWNWFFINGFGLPTTGIELGINPVIVDLKAVAQAPEWLTGGIDGPEGSLITVLVLTIACVLVAKGKILQGKSN